MSVVGIDLGTTNTVVACVRQGKVHVLADERGTRLLPSVVSFHPNGEVLVGGAAKSRRVIDPRNTIYSHKRLIGRSWGSPEIAQARQRFAFELREGPGQGPLVHARGQDYTLPEISAFVLKRTRQIAETALGSPVERAVITVPAHFNELQRASTKVAGRVSGLEVLRILNEPTAAALAYGLGRKGNERVAVYDFGGGTFDCTLLDLNGNVFEVLATAGDSFLGGDDIDNLIADRMAETYLKAHRNDPRTDPQMYERLRTTAEDLKMALSTADTHTVVLKELGHGVGGSSVNFTFTLSRRELEAMMTPLIDKSFKVTQDALALARLTPTAFDKIILVGGSTRAPLIKQRVEAFFGQAPMDKVNPDEVVAIGAAIQAAALTEGQRKRSIPAPPPVPGKPRTLPGVGDERSENTYTSELNANKPAAAFASEPPSFGFTPQTSPPPKTRSGPPPTGATGARPPPESLTGERRATNVGVAPATRPQGPASARMAPPPGHDDDPSIASFPDLAVPTPFEWFPSSGTPSSGSGDTQTGQVGSERSFGGNTITETQTQAAVSSGAQTNPRGPGFGAIDEPPSMYSTPSASVPSFPSMNAGVGGEGLPSPLGDSAPSYKDSDGGAFGVITDNSLVSTSGVSTSGVSTQQAFGHASDLSLISQNTATAAMEAITQARQKALQEGTFDDGDETEAQLRPGGKPAGGTMQLSPAANPGAKPPEDMDLPALAGEKADLPAVVSRAGRPGAPGAAVRKTGQLGMSPSGGAAMAGKPPPAKAPQPFGPMERRGDEGPVSRTAAMPARPPPVPASARGGAASPGGGPRVPTAPPPPIKPSAPPAAVPTTSPMQARAAAARTETFGSAPPPQPPPPAFQSSPQAGPFQSSPPTNAPFGSAPPAPFANTAPFGLNEPFQSAPPQAGGHMNLSEPFGSAPPAGNAPFGSAPPPGFGSQPPAAFGARPGPAAMQSAPGGNTLPLQGRPPPPAPFTAPMAQPPPQHQYSPSAPPPPQANPYAASQPPMFGFPSAPPEMGNEPIGALGGTPLFEMGGGMSGQTQQPPHPGAVQSIGYQSPVLVDVTPRALVVETAGGYTDTIIPRNSKIPCERTRRFATGRDNQTTVRVRVGQGESQFFPQNTFLGEVDLSGLRPAPRGEVVVAVTFEVDADGTLRIRARDVATGQEARATLQLIGVADESSVVMMINRFAQQPVSGGGPQGPQ